jgi:SHS2 domain-containing protein
MTPGWEHLDLGSKIGVRAWGGSRAEAFAHAAEGMFALMLAPDDVATPETREARAQGETPESLLVNWLNECLYVHEIEGFAVARVEVDTCRDGLVHGLLHGEPLDPARHRMSALVKGAVNDRVEVHDDEGSAEVRVVIDA